MRIIFLGTGTSTGVPEIACQCDVCTSDDPRDKRLRTSALVSVDGKNILIDCGPDFRQQMIDVGVKNLDAVLLTHGHYDHAGGLDDLRPFCKHHSVPVYLEDAVANDIRTRLPYCFGSVKYPGIPDIELIGIDEDSFRIGRVVIQPIRVLHYKLPILGYRIGKMAYITDMLTLPDEELVKLEGLEVLIINALRQTPHLSHQTLESALQLIAKVAPRHAYLIHLSHQMGLHQEISRLLPAHVEIAYDGLVIDC